MESKQELVGTVEKILFQAQDTGFAVFSVQVGQGNSVIVRSYLHTIHAGEIVTLHGAWVSHPKWGRQFQADSCFKTPPKSSVGLKKYLASGLIKGIGPVYADRLVDHFGSQVLDVIAHEPHRLHEVTGIGSARIEKIIHAWKDQKEIAAIMVFLQEKGISSAYAMKIYKRYGQSSMQIVQHSPYSLAADIWGIGFKVADQIAQCIGIAANSLPRFCAGIIHAITTTIENGHLYVELDELKEEVRTLLADALQDKQSFEERMTKAFHDLYEQRSLVLVTYEGKHFITLPVHYHTERGIAQKIAALQAYPPACSLSETALHQLLQAHGQESILLNEDQQSGIITCLRNKVTIITGGPGTGKTTLIKKLLTILDKEQISYKLAAPTGRAAKRITENTGRQAVTIHRLLSFDFITRSFTHDDKNTLKVGFLIIDESSMLDVFLAHAVLKAIPLYAHILFIGDVDQLPSVGAGNFLHDLIASDKVPTVHLKTIFRQAENSLIIVNAHRVNRGEFPLSSLPNAKKDFLFIKEDNPALVGQHLQTLFTSGIPQYGIAAENTLVLVPMNKGQVGTHELNQIIQETVNPGTHMSHFTHAQRLFKLGDQVMQIRNNYDKLVFNGDMGHIVALDMQEKALTVSYFGRQVVYEAGECDELVLAYAVTIHKSQGSEYDAVVIPIFMQHFVLLQRNLLYTAITRAKKLCILIGQAKAIGFAVRNTKSNVRNTFLKQYLTTDLVCR